MHSALLKIIIPKLEFSNGIAASKAGLTRVRIAIRTLNFMKYWLIGQANHESNYTRKGVRNVFCTPHKCTFRF